MQARAEARPQVPRREFGVQGTREVFVSALESRVSAINDPVAKLKYIRGTLARYERTLRVIEVVPFSPARRWLCRWLSLEGFRHIRLTNSLGALIPVPRSVRRSLLVNRATAVAAVLAVAGATAAAMAYRPTRAATTPAAIPGLTPRRAIATPLPPVAEELTPLPAGVKPATIFMVDRGSGWEQYSNGLRLDTTYVVAGDPRRYRVFDESSGMREGIRHQPAGILYHTSESDVWPLEATFNERLRDSSQGLLRYVQRLKLYNYLIDRFGRVYRVVEDGSKANHAGNSIWVFGTDVYLNLNNSFLGICFESRWGGGRALPITAAQLAAGRSLTELLRQRYKIAAETCVTHGLTSVNARKHLIGHHVDWARGFPFEAFGLPDQYARTAPSVAVFGFGYDDDFLKVLGEPWPGVLEAERALVAEAGRTGRSLDDVRREKRRLYDRWHEEQAQELESGLRGGRT